MRRTTFIVVTLAALAGMAACGPRETSPTEGLQLPIAQTRSVAPSPSTGGTGAADAPDESQPVPEPTVAKTQKWVKIFSGPSSKDVKPNADKRKGSNKVELNATENAQIGTYVADGAGRTLYRFDNDKANPPKSNCNGSCATAWPPLLIKSPGKIYPKGIDPKSIGYVERANGTCQVTIDGWPVYYFISDSEPGDINGQGVNGKWFAIAPNGDRTKAIPGFPQNSTSPQTGGR
jgi:predicted lipoprotein with Yx(FWY)xxD motif